MFKENVQVVTDASKPSFLSRIPASKKIAAAALVAGAVALAVWDAKTNKDSELETTESDSND
jgi:hypothetical protein